MKTATISSDRFDAIANVADHGDYTNAAVSLLSPNLHRVERAHDAHYLVIESAYTITIIQLDAEGRPYAILGRD
jgi:hypothetical protein